MRHIRFLVKAYPHFRLAVSALETVLMTVVPDNRVRQAHLCLALNLSNRSLLNHVLAGNIPRPDDIGPGKLRLWKLATIRAWNPAVADTVEMLLQHPALDSRTVRTRTTPLLAA